MNGANVVVSSHHRAGETFQNDAESARCDIKATRLKPDTIRVRNPETVIFQVDVGNEVVAAPSTCLEAVGETAKGSDRHGPSSCQSIEPGIEHEVNVFRSAARAFRTRTRRSSGSERCFCPLEIALGPVDRRPFRVFNRVAVILPRQPVSRRGSVRKFAVFQTSSFIRTPHHGGT